MSPKQIYFLLSGLALFLVGVLFVGFDFGHFRRDVASVHIDGAIADDPGRGKRPRPYTEEELRSEMFRAEEYLRQNSRDSASRAMEIYNSVLSYDSNPRVNEVARFGLASALHRLGEDRRALEHLRLLKKDAIKDQALSENVDSLLGRILLMMGHDDEGRAVLNALLSRTTDRVIQSRIHATFGDYYALKGEREKARRSYRIAVEYYPDNFHAVISGESARRFARSGGADHDLYESRLSERVFDDSELHGDVKGKENKPKARKTKHRPHAVPSNRRPSSPAGIQFDLQRAEDGYAQGLILSRKNAHLEAVKVYLDAEHIVDSLLQSDIPDPELKAKALNLNEKLLYRIGETYTSLDDRHLAHTYFDRVLGNPDPSLDQAALVRKGILYFDARDYDAAYLNFNRAVHEFPDGNFTRRAEEWLRETENLMKNRTP